MKVGEVWQIKRPRKFRSFQIKLLEYKPHSDGTNGAWFHLGRPSEDGDWENHHHPIKADFVYTDYFRVSE